jgi:hypothetical protein
MPHSEWVSPEQVVLKKGGMTVVKQKRWINPTTNSHRMVDVYWLPKT